MKRPCCARGRWKWRRIPRTATSSAWPSREQDVEEVDVEKLKAMVHVKDEDIAKLDDLLVKQEAAK